MMPLTFDSLLIRLEDRKRVTLAIAGQAEAAKALTFTNSY